MLEMTNGANNNDNNASPLAPPTLAEVVNRYIPSLTFMNQVVPSTLRTPTTVSTSPTTIARSFSAFTSDRGTRGSETRARRE